MPDQDRIVAIGLLTQRDVFALGHDLSRVYPIDEAPCFGALLGAIDDADRAFHRAHDARQLASAPRHGATSRG
ncbi:conserved hypothetical protein [Sphingomonas aurantiaca]|jgi:hypothetical protein|uniref:Uncharacterized protein n=1 Tax=Sphingomonas aurantiaca TaxID=185949 RepID=A0A2T5GT32_9SPHN|nr:MULTISPECIES: hypothetical protein [Sphingomonas]KQN15919.1 hypothetical protein ASE79_04180 [Sphingomonas sp. Leaf28]KQN24268.1 hypothetical protein ASF00_15565 [Sphingomonas sp. Leaf34]PTQ62465.1 hypothetical protein C8J26_0745 [Sphingomonas aurantiaca]RZT56780.1 hypothetical protein EV283_0836 [Sphingomonas sp. BK036]VVT12644.1 conserved hypothetical protein [Sphingomonas aurantiaca]